MLMVVVGEGVASKGVAGRRGRGDRDGIACASKQKQVCTSPKEMNKTARHSQSAGPAVGNRAVQVSQQEEGAQRSECGFV